MSTLVETRVRLDPFPVIEEEEDKALLPASKSGLDPLIAARFQALEDKYKKLAKKVKKQGGAEIDSDDEELEFEAEDLTMWDKIVRPTMTAALVGLGIYATHYVKTHSDDKLFMPMALVGLAKTSLKSMLRVCTPTVRLVAVSGIFASAWAVSRYGETIGLDVKEYNLEPFFFAAAVMPIAERGVKLFNLNKLSKDYPALKRIRFLGLKFG